MNTRHLIIVTVVLIIAIILALAYIGFSPSNAPVGTPIPLLMSSISSLGKEDMNVSQGSALQINVTLTSRADYELTVTLENLTLNGVNNSSDYTSWDTSIPQNKVLNYTFSINQLVLQPHGSKSTVLTVNIAEDAPLGQYALTVELGNAQVTYVGGIGLTVRVTPKLK